MKTVTLRLEVEDGLVERLVEAAFSDELIRLFSWPNHDLGLVTVKAVEVGDVFHERDAALGELEALRQNAMEERERS